MLFNDPPDGGGVAYSFSDIRRLLNVWKQPVFRGGRLFYLPNNWATATARPGRKGVVSSVRCGYSNDGKLPLTFIVNYILHQ